MSIKNATLMHKEFMVLGFKRTLIKGLNIYRYKKGNMTFVTEDFHNYEINVKGMTFSVYSKDKIMVKPYIKIWKKLK